MTTFGQAVTLTLPIHTISANFINYYYYYDSGLIKCQKFSQRFTKKRVTVHIYYSSRQEGLEDSARKSLQSKRAYQVIRKIITVRDKLMEKVEVTFLNGGG